MNAAGGDCEHARAKVPRTGDIVRSVTNDDELFGRKARAEMFINSLRSERWQVTTIKRFVAKRARQFEEFAESCDFNFQMRGRLDVSGEQRRKIPGMLIDSLQHFGRARHRRNHMITVAGRAFHLLDITT